MVTSKRERNVHASIKEYLRKFESSIIFKKNEVMFYSSNANQFVIHAIRIKDIERC